MVNIPWLSFLYIKFCEFYRVCLGQVSDGSEGEDDECKHKLVVYEQGACKDDLHMKRKVLSFYCLFNKLLDVYHTRFLSLIVGHLCPAAYHISQPPFQLWPVMRLSYDHWHNSRNDTCHFGIMLHRGTLLLFPPFPVARMQIGWQELE